MSELDAYDYELPRERIAQQPLTRRADARLMVVDRSRQQIEHHHVRDLPHLLPPGDALVLNDTRVVPAALVGRRTQTGGRWRGLFLEADGHGLWRVLGTTRGVLAPGETITLTDRQGEDGVRLVLIDRREKGEWIARPEPPGAPLEILARVGRVPLPPYIRGGEMTAADWEAYQTVYAAKPGAVAAPTAGLHFTERLLAELAAAGVAQYRVTLHVGLGTFRPIEVEQLADHRMHSEWGSIDAPTAEALREVRRQGRRIVAVGTTVVRVLETAADAEGTIHPWSGQTDLFIRPPYRFRAVDALMTNFHLPRSTLLVLVRCFGGDRLMQRAYEEAIAAEYRFFSYGDAMLIV